MKKLLDEGGRKFSEDKEGEYKHVVKPKNNKQMKQMFPIDFF
jgi:hypothetical protein